MNTLNEKSSEHSSKEASEQEPFDYTYVSSVARIALYDDLRSAPRVTEIMPAPTADYIEALATTIYEQAKSQGGTIPYTVIREVSENFIHARFVEIIVSILDGGNTIRFADQGPGIKNKDKAQLPGFSSAIEPMKSYIRGVGSGLPIVRDYLEFSHGTISIEDNMGQGAVVTISLKGEEGQSRAASLESIDPEPHVRGEEAATQAATPRQIVSSQVTPRITAQQALPQQQYAQVQPQLYQQMAQVPSIQAYPQQPVQAYAQIPSQQVYPQQAPAIAYAPAAVAQAYQAPYGAQAQVPQRMAVPQLNQRERDFLNAFLAKGALGVTDLARLTGTPASSTHSTLTKLEEEGLVEMAEGQKKRVLTDFGFAVAEAM